MAHLVTGWVPPKFPTSLYAYCCRAYVRWLTLWERQDSSRLIKSRWLADRPITIREGKLVAYFKTLAWHAVKLCARESEFVWEVFWFDSRAGSRMTRAFCWISRNLEAQYCWWRGQITQLVTVSFFQAFCIFFPLYSKNARHVFLTHCQFVLVL